MICPFTVRLLGGHVGQGADDEARTRQFAPAHDLDQAKVGQDNAVILGGIHHDVAWLDIAVNKAALMCIVECAGELVDNVHNALVREGATCLDEPCQRAPFYVFHGNVVYVVLAAHVIDGDDVRMLQGGRRTRFTQKACHHVRIHCLLGGEDLDRHRVFQHRVIALVDGGHAAGTDLCDDVVLPQGLANQGHTFGPLCEHDATPEKHCVIACRSTCASNRLHPIACPAGQRATTRVARSTHVLASRRGSRPGQRSPR